MTQQRETNAKHRILVRTDAFLKDLVPGFLNNRRKDVLSINDALETGNFEAILILGHKMRGDGAGYGFDAISEIGAALEQAAKEQDSETIRRYAGELSDYVERVEVVYDE
ncbi:MAG: Hpt domain-containing protein [Deltaproteobacteria bacterium]|nr:MAG: Hpt domain-containing protein [Deltaproteobacteria bacterium]